MAQINFKDKKITINSEAELKAYIFAYTAGTTKEKMEIYNKALAEYYKFKNDTEVKAEKKEAKSEVEKTKEVK